MTRRILFPVLLVILLAGCRAPVADRGGAQTDADLHESPFLDPFEDPFGGPVLESPAPPPVAITNNLWLPLPRPEDVHAVAFFGDNVESDDLPLEFIERDPARIAELLRAARITQSNHREEIPDSGPLGYQAFLDADGGVLSVMVPWLDSSGSLAICPTNGWTFDGSALRLEGRLDSDLRESIPEWRRTRTYAGLVYDAMRRNDSPSFRRMDDEFERIDGVERVLRMDPENRADDRDLFAILSRLDAIVIPSMAFTNTPIPQVLAALETAAAVAEDPASREGKPPLRFVYESRMKEGNSPEDDGPWGSMTCSAEDVPLSDVLDVIESVGLIDFFPHVDGTVVWSSRFITCGTVYVLHDSVEFLRGPYHRAPEKARWRRKIASTRVEALALRDEPLDRALAALAAALGDAAPPMEVSFLAADGQAVSFSVPERADSPLRLPCVTLDIRDCTLRDALDDIARQSGMEAEATADGVALFNHERDLSEGEEPSISDRVVIYPRTVPESASERWYFHAKTAMSVLMEEGHYRNTPIFDILDSIRDAVASSESPAHLQFRMEEALWRKSGKEKLTFSFHFAPATDVFDIVTGVVGATISAVGNIVLLQKTESPVYECIEAGGGNIVLLQKTGCPVYECIEAGMNSQESTAFREALDRAMLPGFAARWTSLRDALREIETCLAESGVEVPEEWRGLRFAIDGAVPEASGAVPEETLPEEVVAVRDGRLWLQLDRVSLHDLLDVIGNMAKLRFTVDRGAETPVIAVEPWVP